MEVAEQSVYYRIGDEIALLGYDWKPSPAGKDSMLILYWKAVAPVKDRYQVFVHLRNSKGEVMAQSDKLNPGDYPTTRWPLDKYIRDEHRITVPEGIELGSYSLAVGLWHMSNGERLAVKNAEGTELGDSIFLEKPIY